MTALVCLALAALSLFIPSAPTTDPWGWIVWGHELVYGGFTTVQGGAPSWKPLPVLFTAPLSLFGAAAPALWLVVARAGGLFSLVAARRLGDRLGGPPAGLLAAVGLVLSSDWLRAVAHGYSEPLAIGFLLAAVDGHLTGHPRRALVLGTATALARPETLPLLAAYAVVMASRKRLHWALALGLVTLVPLLWIVPDWAASGNPFHGNEVARLAAPHGLGPGLRAILEGALITPLPLTACAIAAAYVTEEPVRRAVRVIGIAVVAWAALVGVLVLAVYPAVGRYLVLPSALVCVLGAVGAVGVVRTGRSARLAVASLAAALAVGLVARGVSAGDQAIESVRRAQLEHELHAAIDRAGPKAVRSCGVALLARGLGWTRGLVAFDLGVRPISVHSAPTSARSYVGSLTRSGEEGLPPRPPGTVRVAVPETPFVLLAPFGGAPVTALGDGSRLQAIASAGPWRVLVPAGQGDCYRRSFTRATKPGMRRPAGRYATSS
jgi:hypothetical protein